MPCELVPDLEAQVTNQIEDLLSTTLNSTLQSILEKVGENEDEKIPEGEAVGLKNIIIIAGDVGVNKERQRIRQVINEEMK